MPVRHLVTAADTAAALGSGEVPVLATPRLIAWMEAETVRLAADSLEPGSTTGTAVRISHRRATPVGASVDVVASRATSNDGRRLTFAVEARGTSGELVADGEIDRVVSIAIGSWPRRPDPSPSSMAAGDRLAELQRRSLERGQVRWAWNWQR